MSKSEENLYWPSSEFDPLRLKQWETVNLGSYVFGSVQAFNLWKSDPEKEKLFHTMDGLEALHENLIAIDRGYF